MPDVYANRFRRQRFGVFLSVLDRVQKSGPMRVLDIGGVSHYWNAMKPLWEGRDLDITLLNVEGETGKVDDYTARIGNACDLSEFADNAFDVIHSNSVIEHVGPWSNMRAMAQEVRRLAPHHFVQTPNYGFPFEPHFRTLFFHWRSEHKRAQMLMRRPRGFHTVRDYDDAMLRVQSIRLVTRHEMRDLFPDSEIRSERVGPLTKSLIAVR